MAVGLFLVNSTVWEQMNFVKVVTYLRKLIHRFGFIKIFNSRMPKGGEVKGGGGSELAPSLFFIINFCKF